MSRLLSIACMLSLVVGSPSWGRADEKAAEGAAFTVADGKLAFTAPKGWTKKQPRSRIIEVEFEIPAAKGDENAGRFTMMGAGGDVQANIDRWYGQFEQSDGSDSKDKAKVEKKTIAGKTVHYVDVAGTYKDSPSGPFAGGKTIKREDYRMLAAIVETKEAGNYFLKFYGPKATVAENEKAFQEMLGSLQVK
ncbi:MAG TPA: hypothetical protein VMP01_20325 [Pirellulaceae bacterium]|nr:hypothetical protein [Pirellulaceae bacterium]